jgi:hypothetical protein
VITHLLKWKHAALAATVLACITQAIAEAPPELRGDQVRAFTTGKSIGLGLGLGDKKDSKTVQLAKMWTFLAASQFSSAHVEVSEDSAFVLSDFIYDGAKNFVDQNAPDSKIAEVEKTLHDLVHNIIFEEKTKFKGQLRVDLPS